MRRVATSSMFELGRGVVFSTHPRRYLTSHLPSSVHKPCMEESTAAPVSRNAFSLQIQKNRNSSPNEKNEALTILSLFDASPKEG